MLLAVLTIAIAIGIPAAPIFAQKTAGDLKPFDIMEATIPEIHAAMMSTGRLTAHPTSSGLPRSHRRL